MGDHTRRYGSGPPGATCADWRTGGYVRAMSPRARRKAAGIVLVISVLIGWPMSWVIPSIGPPWDMRLLTWLSFLALTFTAADILATTDVRASTDDGSS